VGPRRPQALPLGGDDLRGRADPREPGDPPPADLMQRLEDRDSMPQPRQVPRGAQPGRAAADDADLLARRRRLRREAELAVLALVVGHEPLQVADAHRLELVADDAAALALRLLRADA